MAKELNPSGIMNPALSNADFSSTVGMYHDAPSIRVGRHEEAGRHKQHEDEKTRD